MTRSLEREIETLQSNVKDMQRQLANAHKRILELTNDKNSTVEELENERQLLNELKVRYAQEEAATTNLIQKKMNDIPEVLDSKPKNFKRPPHPGYTVREGEKWVTIKDGKMEFEDIDIKK